MICYSCGNPKPCPCPTGPVLDAGQTPVSLSLDERSRLAIKRYNYLTEAVRGLLDRQDISPDVRAAITVVLNYAAKL